MVRRALSAIDAICKAAANVAAAVVVLIAALAILDIVLRAFFDFGLTFALEYESYALGIVMFAASGWALRHGAHIRVGLLVNLLPRRGRHSADLAATAFSLGISGYVSVAIIRYAIATAERGTVSIQISQTPLIYPQALFAASVCTITLALLARLVRLLIGEAPELSDSGVAEAGT